jgi:hypothetical protein
MISVRAAPTAMTLLIAFFQAPSPQLQVTPESGPPGKEVTVRGANWQEATPAEPIPGPTPGVPTPVKIGFVPEPEPPPSCPLVNDTEEWTIQPEGSTFMEAREVPQLAPGNYTLVACQPSPIEDVQLRATYPFEILEPEESPDKGDDVVETEGAKTPDAEGPESGIEEVVGVADKDVALIITLILTGVGTAIGLSSPFVRAVVRESVTHPFRRAVIRRSGGDISIEASRGRRR